jgi:coenzyme F420-0:L-glutamate ligase/coenzyme F420-1:gamma-L-glutamate ligase
VLDLRGSADRRGYVLQATMIAVSDQIASAAGLVMGKADGVPAALVRGLHLPAAEGSARDLIIPRELDLFP